jgi:nicotinate phosphoribosyltransferase
MIELSAPLVTDLYQLTMAQAYFELGMHQSAVFELFVRRLPQRRRFLLAAGLEQALEYLQGLCFSAADIDFLASLKTFSPDFLSRLSTLRFTGAVHAMPEGTPFFANEPILRVTAPIIEAQLVESRVLNLVHFQTLIASKAVRCVLVARGRRLIDFGMRRAHGAEAAVHAARAAYLAGFDATATVEAGRRFGIPLSGTMAHSYIQAHESEQDAFRHFVAAGRAATTLLIDTYDTERAAGRVAALVQQRRAAGQQERVQAVRIDSGDLAAQALAVRRILDAQGCAAVKIVLSSGLDEYQLQTLLAANTPVDAFGIGTHIAVSEDAPSLDIAYKLEEYAGRPRRKRSPGKATWPGCKQVYREHGAQAQFTGDCIALADESMPGEPLLREVMRDGRRLEGQPPLTASRDWCRRQVALLPPALRELDQHGSDYPVRVSHRIEALAHELDAHD